jgi:hypothetical protein
VAGGLHSDQKLVRGKAVLAKALDQAVESLRVLTEFEVLENGFSRLIFEGGVMGVFSDGCGSI